MNELKIFNNPEFGEVRAIELNGESWLVGKDVADILGYADTFGALKKHVDEEDKLVCQIDSAGQKRDVTVINESGLYSLVLSSKLPNSKKFKRWVTSEVLPEIRKHGGYIQTKPEMTPEEIMAKAILLANATIENQKKKIGELEVKNSELTVEVEIGRPKVEYFNALVDRNLLTNLRTTAKELNVPQNQFVSFLLEKKYLYRDKHGNLLPYAKNNDGLFELKEYFNNNWANVQTLVTPKGRETFRLLMIGAGKAQNA